MSTFNTLGNGPVEIGESWIKRFEKDNALTPKEQYLYWVNDNNPAQLRRLHLRALLRSAFYEEDGCNEEDFEAFASVLCAADLQPRLCDTLKYRKELLREFSDELLYALEHQMVPIARRTADNTMSYLLGLVMLYSNQDTGERFVQYHYCSDLSKEPLLTLFYALSEEVVALREWYKSKLWAELMNRVLKFLKTDPGELYDAPDGAKVRTIRHTKDNRDFLRFVNQILEALDRAHDDKVHLFIENCVYLLENNLPPDVIWNEKHIDILRHAQLLRSERFALSYCQRHLSVIRDAADLPWRISDAEFYWLYGLVHRIDAANEKFIRKLDYLWLRLHKF